MKHGLREHPCEGDRWAPGRERQFRLRVSEEPTTRYHGNKGEAMGWTRRV